MAWSKKQVVTHALALASGLFMLGAFVIWAEPLVVLRAAKRAVPVLPFFALLFLSAWVTRVGVLRWISISSQIPMNWRTANRAYLASNVLNILFPAGAGDVALILNMSPRNNYGRVTALMATYRLQSFLGMICIAVALAVMALTAWRTDSQIGVALLLASALVVAGLATLPLVGTARLATTGFVWMGRGAARLKPFGFIARRARGLQSGLRLALKPRFFLLGFLGSTVAGFAETMLLALVVMAIAPKISVLGAIAAPVFGRFAMMLRLTPGGLGIVEGTMIMVLVGQGVDVGDAVAAATSGRLLALLLLICLGALPAYSLLRNTLLKSVTGLQSWADRDPDDAGSPRPDMANPPRGPH